MWIMVKEWWKKRNFYFYTVFVLSWFLQIYVINSQKKEKILIQMVRFYSICVGVCFKTQFEIER